MQGFPIHSSEDATPRFDCWWAPSASYAASVEIRDTMQRLQACSDGRNCGKERRAGLYRRKGYSSPPSCAYREQMTIDTNVIYHVAFVSKYQEFASYLHGFRAYGCYILRSFSRQKRYIIEVFSLQKDGSASHTASAEDGKRWRWLLWIFRKMEKGEDGISGSTPKVSSKISFLFSFPG